MRIPKTSSCRKLIAYDCLKALIVMPLMPAEGVCMGKNGSRRSSGNKILSLRQGLRRNVCYVRGLNLANNIRVQKFYSDNLQSLKMEDALA